jgi:hypothetical protein
VQQVEVESKKSIQELPAEKAVIETVPSEKTV